MIKKEIYTLHFYKIFIFQTNAVILKSIQRILGGKKHHGFDKNIKQHNCLQIKCCVYENLNTTEYRYMTCKKKILNCVRNLLKRAQDYFFIPSIC